MPQPTIQWDKSNLPSETVAIVKRFEGFSETPYDDNGSLPGGTWTIGYGTIVDAKGKAVTQNTPKITEAQAEELLGRDMGSATKAVARRVQVEVLTYQAAALISWTFNLGEGALAGSTMLKCVNAGDFAAVPDQMRRWINQGDTKVLGLLRRRWAEAATFLGMAPVDAVTRAWKLIDTLDDWPSFDPL